VHSFKKIAPRKRFSLILGLLIVPQLVSSILVLFDIVAPTPTACKSEQSVNANRINLRFMGTQCGAVLGGLLRLLLSRPLCLLRGGKFLHNRALSGAVGGPMQLVI